MLTFKNRLAYYKGFCFGSYNKMTTDDGQEKWFVLYKEIVEFQTGDKGIYQNHIHLNIDKTEIQVQRFLDIKFANWQEFWK